MIRNQFTKSAIMAVAIAMVSSQDAKASENQFSVWEFSRDYPESEYMALSTALASDTRYVELSELVPTPSKISGHILAAEVTGSPATREEIISQSAREFTIVLALDNSIMKRLFSLEQDYQAAETAQLLSVALSIQGKTEMAKHYSDLNETRAGILKAEQKNRVIDIAEEVVRMYETTQDEQYKYGAIEYLTEMQLGLPDGAFEAMMDRLN